MTRLSIIIPAYNEAQTIAEMIERVRQVDIPVERELIVVDDASTDGTADVLRRLMAGQPTDLRVVRHPRNAGTGAAVRTGLAQAGGDIILIQDADLETDPRDYPALLKPILDGEAQVVFGDRFHGESRRSWHRTGNALLTSLTNVLTGLRLSDMEVGYKVFRAEAIKRITIRSNRFGFEPEVTIKLARLGYRVHEVPIRYHSRTRAEGKKIKWRDGAAALFHIVRYRFFDRAATRP